MRQAAALVILVACIFVPESRPAQLFEIESMSCFQLFQDCVSDGEPAPQYMFQNSTLTTF